jgi:hypothetical protein
VSAAAAALLGHRLCTVMRHDAALGRNRRVFSSDPANWPVGGWKAVSDTAWSRALLAEGRPWLCRDEAEIAATFPDHALILSRGLGSSLNLPIRRGGATLGALNLLHVAGHFAEEHADRGVAWLGGLRLPPL